MPGVLIKPGVGVVIKAGVGVAIGAPATCSCCGGCPGPSPCTTIPKNVTCVVDSVTLVDCATDVTAGGYEYVAGDLPNGTYCLTCPSSSITFNANAWGYNGASGGMEYLTGCSTDTLGRFRIAINFISGAAAGFQRLRCVVAAIHESGGALNPEFFDGTVDVAVSNVCTLASAVTFPTNSLTLGAPGRGGTVTIQAGC